MPLDPATRASLSRYVRAADYLAAAQIYLRDNALLERPLAFSDIKPRLLGHWGTCPGINLAYAHLSLLARETGQEMLFVLGPGHGFAALQANLFIEGTLERYYPSATPDKEGVAYLTRNFSWPYGFPSHTNPGAPGAILEGGELGYSLATAYGAALDSPNLLVAALIGDGEAETGPLATAWHLNKFVDPRTNGAVLPILHRNGYKISGPTIFGRMSEDELRSLFAGYGYEPRFVTLREDGDVHEDLYAALRESHDAIRRLKAGDGNCPRWPMIVLTTPKGWTGPKELGGVKLEGNYASHQVVAAEAGSDPAQLRMVEEWLRSYRFEELFDPQAGFAQDIRDLVPADPQERIGNNRQCFGGDDVCLPLLLPDTAEDENPSPERGVSQASSMRAAGGYLRRVMDLNAAARNFRLFSPDETYSNKLDAVFQATARAFVWPRLPHDRDLAPDGRVIEMLSEHSLQGLMQGYVLTGRHAVFPSYEAFLQIVVSMVDQYAKFIRVARELPWRGSVASLNYILTSPGWAQEHNGFSHQNPGFIDAVLQKHGTFARVYFPPDRNATLAVLRRMLGSKDGINLLVAGKADEPEWLTPAEAEAALQEGVLTWEFASDGNPDLVLAAAGDYLVKESLAAMTILRKDVPAARLRFVNVVELTAAGIGNGATDLFERHFTADKPVIMNFHGYPETMKQALFDQPGASGRVVVNGYVESGSTTTPFDMHVRNGTSRYHVARQGVESLARAGVLAREEADRLAAAYGKVLDDHRAYIVEHGVDPEFVAAWRWKR